MAYGRHEFGLGSGACRIDRRDDATGLPQAAIDQHACESRLELMDGP
jgi:hypothetical protein